jgi:hypothetical protein
MPTKIKCKCGREYRVNEDQAGKRLRCKACGATIAVPGNAAVTTAPTPKRAAKVPVPMPMDEPIQLRPGESTASNPSRTRVDLLQYFICYPATPLFLLVFVLTGFVCAIATGFWWMVPVCTAIGCVKGIRQIRPILFNINRFRRGNVNPAVVMEKSGLFSWKVAVFADLDTTGGGDAKPSIFVGHFPLGLMAGGPPTPGMKLAAPSSYFGMPNQRAWSFFRPMIANCCVRNPLTLNRLMATVSPEEWEWLESSLPLIPSQKPGVYPLWEGAKNVPMREPSKITTVGFYFAAAVVMLALIAVVSINPQKKREEETRPMLTPFTPQPTVQRPATPPPPQPESIDDKMKRLMKPMQDQAEQQKQNAPGK